MGRAGRTVTAQTPPGAWPAGQGNRIKLTYAVPQHKYLTRLGFRVTRNWMGQREGQAMQQQAQTPSGAWPQSKKLCRHPGTITACLFKTNTGGKVGQQQKGLPTFSRFHNGRKWNAS